MEFIEVVEGLSIRKDAIVSVKATGDGKLFITTESRDFAVIADYNLVMKALEEEELIKQRIKKITSQYFGG